jgi:hypothetical protein
MSEQNPDTKVYARIENGEIKEYPVFAVHILNRAHPFDWYTEVHFDAQPEVPEFHRLKETLSMLPDLSTGKYIVRATYSIEAISLAELLSSLRKPAEGEGAMPGQLSDVPMDIADVPPAMVDRVAYLATFLAQEKMDQFAQTRNYENINTAIGYFNSGVPKFQQEAAYCNSMRDSVWVSFYQYLSDVLSAVKPVPTQVSDIEAILPPMVWPT